jgi:hypothetical protein
VAGLYSFLAEIQGLRSNTPDELKQFGYRRIRTRTAPDDATAPASDEDEDNSGAAAGAD